MIENFSTPTQLISLLVVLVILFFAVRANARHNRKNRLNRRDREFGAKLRENQKKKKTRA